MARLLDSSWEVVVSSSALGTMSGELFQLFGDSLDGITIEAVAFGLEREIRWGGQTLEAWSVAEHCIAVAEVLRRDGAPPEMRLAGLMHDAEEGLLRDIMSPLKRHLLVRMPDGSVQDYETALERPIRARICRALGFEWVDVLCDTRAVKKADALVLDAERCHFRHFRQDIQPMGAGRVMRMGDAIQDIRAMCSWRRSGALPSPAYTWMRHVQLLAEDCEAIRRIGRQ